MTKMQPWRYRAYTFSIIIFVPKYRLLMNAAESNLFCYRFMMRSRSTKPLPHTPSSPNLKGKVPPPAQINSHTSSSPHKASHRENVSARKYRVHPAQRRHWSNSTSFMALGILHVLLVVVLGVHNEWAWSTELLRFFNELAVGTV